jgi:hypothetical protein
MRDVEVVVSEEQLAEARHNGPRYVGADRKLSHFYG